MTLWGRGRIDNDSYVLHCIHVCAIDSFILTIYFIIVSDLNSSLWPTFCESIVVVCFGWLKNKNNIFLNLQCS